MSVKMVIIKNKRPTVAFIKVLRAVLAHTPW